MAAPKRVKVKEGENLSDAYLERVIKLLSQDKPITKKEACQVLNISYNTARLTTILDNYQARKESDNKRRAANRGKPATPDEVKTVINDYLDGDSIAVIADGLFRPSSFVKTIIDNVGIPQRNPGENYFNYSSLPEECIADEFEVGEIVWSSRHQSAALVQKDLGFTRDGQSKLYRIYVTEKWEVPEKLAVNYTGPGGFYSSQPAYELGKLSHLEQYGVDLKRKFT